MEETYVGIDIHRDYGVACVRDLKGGRISIWEQYRRNTKSKREAWRKQCACSNRVNRQHVGCIVGILLKKIN